MKSLYQSYRDGTLSAEIVRLAAIEQTFLHHDKGFCINCGTEHDGIHPGDENLPCDVCGQNGVCGAEALVMKGETPEDSSLPATMHAIEGDLRKLAEIG